MSWIFFLYFLYHPYPFTSFLNFSDILPRYAYISWDVSNESFGQRGSAPRHLPYGSQGSSGLLLSIKWNSINSPLDLESRSSFIAGRWRRALSTGSLVELARPYSKVLSSKLPVAILLVKVHVHPREHQPENRVNPHLDRSIPCLNRSSSWFLT